jgi:hypothetical protein
LEDVATNNITACYNVDLKMLLGKIYIYNLGQHVSKFDAGIGLHAIWGTRLQRKYFLPPVTEPRRPAASSHYSVLEP